MPFQSLPDSKNKMMRSSIGIMMIAIIMASYGVEAMTRCDECQVAVSLADRYLASNGTEVTIEEYVCNIMPVSYRGSCLAFMEKMLPSAISYIENKYTPLEICETIKVCTNSTQLMKPTLWKFKY